MVTSPEYRHVPTGTLAILAQRLGSRVGVALDVVSGGSEVWVAAASAPGIQPWHPQAPVYAVLLRNCTVPGQFLA